VRIAAQDFLKGNLVDHAGIIKATLAIGEGDCAAAPKPCADLRDTSGVINDAGGGRIGCGGITDAAVKCKVSVNCIVEKKVNGSWSRVTSWSSTNTYAYSASVSKYLSVGSGYYYRVRCNHAAGSDTSNSYTSALWM
jgi:hypothetical protein